MFHSSISADTQLNVHRLFFWVFNELLVWSHVRRHSSTCGSMHSKQCFIVQSVPRLYSMFIDRFSGHSMNSWSRVTCCPSPTSATLEPCSLAFYLHPCRHQRHQEPKLPTKIHQFFTTADSDEVLSSAPSTSPPIRTSLSDR